MPFIGDGFLKNQYFVIELNDNDLYSQHFYEKEEALEFINQSENKCYLVYVEYDGGVYRFKSEPYT